MPRRVAAFFLGLAVAVATAVVTQVPASAQSGPTVDKTVSVDGIGSSRTTAAFSTTAAGDVLVAFVAADGPSPGAQTATVSGGGLTWSLVKRVNSQPGTSEIWTANAPSVLTNVTVTSTEGSGAYYQSLTVVAYTGASGIGASVGASAASGAPGVTLTTTKSGSLVYGVGNDWSNGVARTLGANQTMVHQYLAPVGDTYWVQSLTNAVTTAGTAAQLNDTAPTADQWNLAAVEILALKTFQVVPYNGTLNAGQSDSATYYLQVSPAGGFTGPLTCSVSAMPAASTAVAKPTGGPPQPGPIAVTIATGAATTAGTYHPVVTCTAGTLSASATLTLVVTTLPDFRIALEPNSLTISQGQAGIADIEMEAINGYVQGTTFTVAAVPSGVVPTFALDGLVPTASGTLQLAVGGSTAPGVYPLVVTATSTDGTVVRQSPFTLTVLAQNASGSWRQQALGDSTAQLYGAIVGDVGNTGKSRVYGTGGDGLLYEYSFNATSWSFAKMPVGVASDGIMHNGGIGPGRNDGVNRLYVAATLSGRVYEASWVNGAWQVAVVGTLTGASDVAVGYGRNDGQIRIYATAQSGASEFTWNGSGWTQVVMGAAESGEVHGLDVGPGRNDGINRVYTANDANGRVYEYSWNGSTWDKLLMGTNVDARNIHVGDGRNDGQMRAYVASADGNVYEYTWNGTSWQNASIGTAGTTGVKVQALPLKTKGDNAARVYAAGADGGVYEYSWSGSAWQTTRLGSATAYMYGLDAGDVLNQGTTQIYGSSYDGNVYLFEWIPTVAAPPVVVPNIVGELQGAVAGILGGVGLVAGTATNQASTTVPIGVVVSQSPASGTQAPEGSAVAFSVSSGVGVPNVVNQTQSNATTAIVNAGLTASVSTASSTTVAAGLVISQAPAAGTHLSGGSSVTIVVSTGPPPVTVPNVVGQTQATATSAIVAAGLTVGTITTAVSGSTPPGSVISQSVAAGTQVAPGTAINLVIALATVPNVVGQSQAAATAAITGAGLTVGTITTAASTSVPAGSVISQSLASGTQVAAGTAVNLVVSSGPPLPGPAVDSVVFSDGTGTRTTPTFSTSAAGDLLLAFAAADGPSTGGQTLTVSGAGLTWTLVKRSNTQDGTAEVWKATAAALLSDVTVTSTQTKSGYHASVTVVAFKGSSGTGASAAASGASGAQSVTLVSTRAGSLVYGVGNDWDRAVARTLGTNQTMTHQWVDTAVGDTFWVQALTGTVPAIGTSVQLNDTAPTNDRWNFVGVEIMPVGPTTAGPTPASGSTNVSLSAVPTVVFNQAMAPATITASTFFLKDATNTTVPATVSYNASYQAATLTPTNPLVPGPTTYTATLKGGTGGVTDLAGNPMAADLVWSFTTIPKTPIVTTVSPVNTATNVSVNSAVTVTFSDTMTAATINASTVMLRDSQNKLVPATVTYDAPSVTARLQPSSALNASDIYTVTVAGGSGGVANLAGTPMPTDVVWFFTTASSVVLNTAHPLAQGMVGLWHFNSSTTPVNLVFPGDPVLSPGFTGTPTFQPNGWGFIPSSTAYLGVNDGGSGGLYDFTTGPFTVEFDFLFNVMPPSSVSGAVGIGRDSFQVAGWLLTLANADAGTSHYRWGPQWNRPGIEKEYMAYQLVPNSFARVTMVITPGANPTLYLNGVAATSGCCDPWDGTASYSGLFRIGQDEAGNSPKMPISRVIVWNRALSAAEVMQIGETSPFAYMKPQ